MCSALAGNDVLWLSLFVPSDFVSAAQDMITDIIAIDSLVPLVTTSLLASYINHDQDVKERFEKYVQQILQLLSKRYPLQLDQGLRVRAFIML